MVDMQMIMREFPFNKRLRSYGLEPMKLPTNFKNSMAEKNKMTTLREEAHNYKPATTKNICELQKVYVDADIKTKVVNAGEENEFSYNYILVDEQEYRVPVSVIKQLQAQLQENKDATLFKVVKKGEGMKTEYTVVMLD